MAEKKVDDMKTIKQENINIITGHYHAGSDRGYAEMLLNDSNIESLAIIPGEEVIGTYFGKSGERKEVSGVYAGNDKKTGKPVFLNSDEIGYAKGKKSIQGDVDIRIDKEVTVREYKIGNDFKDVQYDVDVLYATRLKDKKEIKADEIKEIKTNRMRKLGTGLALGLLFGAGATYGASELVEHVTGNNPLYNEKTIEGDPIQINASSIPFIGSLIKPASQMLVNMSDPAYSADLNLSEAQQILTGQIDAQEGAINFPAYSYTEREDAQEILSYINGTFNKALVPLTVNIPDMVASGEISNLLFNTSSEGVDVTHYSNGDLFTFTNETGNATGSGYFVFNISGTQMIGEVDLSNVTLNQTGKYFLPENIKTIYVPAQQGNININETDFSITKPQTNITGSLQKPETYLTGNITDPETVTSLEGELDEFTLSIPQRQVDRQFNWPAYLASVSLIAGAAGLYGHSKGKKEDEKETDELFGKKKTENDNQYEKSTNLFGMYLKDTFNKTVHGSNAEERMLNIEKRMFALGKGVKANQEYQMAMLELKNEKDSYEILLDKTDDVSELNDEVVKAVKDNDMEKLSELLNEDSIEKYERYHRNFDMLSEYFDSIDSEAYSHFADELNKLFSTWNVKQDQSRAYESAIENVEKQYKNDIDSEKIHAEAAEEALAESQGKVEDLSKQLEIKTTEGVEHYEIVKRLEQSSKESESKLQVYEKAQVRQKAMKTEVSLLKGSIKNMESEVEKLNSDKEKYFSKIEELENEKPQYIEKAKQDAIKEQEEKMKEMIKKTFPDSFSEISYENTIEPVSDPVSDAFLEGVNTYTEQMQEYDDEDGLLDVLDELSENLKEQADIKEFDSKVIPKKDERNRIDIINDVAYKIETDLGYKEFDRNDDMRKLYIANQYSDLEFTETEKKQIIGSVKIKQDKRKESSANVTSKEEMEEIKKEE